jgi:hypothetical protein
MQTKAGHYLIEKLAMTLLQHDGIKAIELLHLAAAKARGLELGRE